MKPVIAIIPESGAEAVSSALSIEGNTDINLKVKLPATTGQKCVHASIQVAIGGMWYGMQGVPDMRTGAKAQEITVLAAAPIRASAIRLQVFNPVESEVDAGASAEIYLA